jgi:hypothetical protein
MLCESTIEMLIGRVLPNETKDISIILHADPSVYNASGHYNKNVSRCMSTFYLASGSPPVAFQGHELSVVVELVPIATTNSNDSNANASSPIKVDSNNDWDIISNNNNNNDANASSIPRPPIDIRTQNWGTELQTLYDMGFYDIDALIPLLEEHVKVSRQAHISRNDPSALWSDKHSAGMQVVVGQLLMSQSMINRG